MRLIDADMLRSEIEDRIEQMTSEAVKGGMRFALLVLEMQPTKNVVTQPVVIDAEEIAQLVVERLNK